MSKIKQYIVQMHAPEESPVILWESDKGMREAAEDFARSVLAPFGGAADVDIYEKKRGTKRIRFLFDICPTPGQSRTRGKI